MILLSISEVLFGISSLTTLLNFLCLRTSAISPAMSSASSSCSAMSSFLVMRKCDFSMMVSSGKRR